MNMNNTAEDFSIGQRVNVEPLPEDFFEPFTGRVVGFRQCTTTNGKFVQVRDMDDEDWDCCPEQVSPNTDEIMHSDSCGHLPNDL